MTASAGATLWDVVEEHLDEASFLLELRRSRLAAPNYVLDEVRDGPEARLLAHIEGLVIAGEPARERLLQPIFADDEAEAAPLTVAALCLLWADDDRALGPRVCFDALRRAGATHGRTGALADALALAERQDVAGMLVRELEQARSPEHAAALLRALAADRIDPGALLAPWLQHDDPTVLTAALTVAAAVPRLDCVRRCESLTESAELEVRNAAFTAAITMASPVAWANCRARAASATSEDAHCLLLLGLLGTAADHALLAKLLRHGETLQAALWAASFAGRQQLIDAAVELVEQTDERVAKLAAEVLIAATTYRPSKYELVTDADEEVSFEEDDLDKDLAALPVDRLPRVTHASARAYWAQHRSELDPAFRHSQGRKLDISVLHHNLRHGPAHRRQPWALGVAAGSGGRCAISVEALCPRQERELAALRAADPNILDALVHGYDGQR